MAGLYIHIPFCHAKCAYCDFFSSPSTLQAANVTEAIVREWQMRRCELNEPLYTVYIGGGTPSCLPYNLLKSLIQGLQLPETVQEFTMEVNPEDVTAEAVAQWRYLGINRISMGVQSLDDRQLRAVGRRHTAAQALQAIERLQRSFTNISLDLIYGLPGQDLASWKRSLNGLLATGASSHLSCYLLSYEPGTRLWAQLQTAKVKEASESSVQLYYSYLCEAMHRRGFDHYEISNFALPGRRSRHNSSYWDMIPYVGLGPAAHSFDGRDTRRANPCHISRYLAAINDGHTAFTTEKETPQDLTNDRILTSLRRVEGLDLTTLPLQPDEKVIASLVASGHLRREGSRIFIPEQRWLVSDMTIRQLLL